MGKTKVIALYFLSGLLGIGGLVLLASFVTSSPNPYKNCINIDEYLEQADKYHTRSFLIYYNQRYLERIQKLLNAGILQAPIDKIPLPLQKSPTTLQELRQKNNQTSDYLPSEHKNSTITRSQLFELMSPPSHTKMLQDFGRKEEKFPTCIDGRISSNPEFYDLDLFRKNKNKTEFIDGKAFDQWYHLYWFYHFENYLLDPEIHDFLYTNGAISQVYRGEFESSYVPEIQNMREYFIQDIFLDLSEKELYFGSKIIQ